MHTEAGHLYHMFNQGNNKEVLFNDASDYNAFTELIKRHLVPVCEVLAWCLMPNHFHFCIQATEVSVKEVVSGNFLIQAFSRSTGNMLSAYSAVLNSKQQKTGARFKPRTKLKLITDAGNGYYDEEVVHYIHGNPVVAGLAATPEEWPYSSAAEYAGLRTGFCNLELARRLGLLIS